MQKEEFINYMASGNLGLTVKSSVFVDYVRHSRPWSDVPSIRAEKARSSIILC